MLTVDLASPNLYTITFGLDGEGRRYSLKDAGTTEVTSATFNAAGRPLVITLAPTSGTEKDTYTYDAYERMTGADFDVNGTHKTDTLTWNANNTLELLGTVDGFNSTATDYCAFNSTYVTGTGYDDLACIIREVIRNDSQWCKVGYESQ